MEIAGVRIPASAPPRAILRAMIGGRNAFPMLAELGVMDWIALFAAATILAAAAAMIVIALTLTGDRTRARRQDADRLAGAPPVRRATPSNGSLVTFRSAVSPDEARAMRADRLLRRPEPETPRRSVLDAPAAPKASILSSDGAREIGFEVRDPGFFDDPLGRYEQRYWDGDRWTEYVKTETGRFIDPM